AWHFNARAAGKDRVLLRPTATENQVFHAIDVIQLRCMHMSVEDDQLQVLGISRDGLVGIVSLRNGAKAGAAKDWIMKDDERLFIPLAFGAVQPLLQLHHLLCVFWPIRIPERR